MFYCDYFIWCVYVTSPPQTQHTNIYIYIYIYKYIRTLKWCTVPISVYTTVHEPIQQHTAVHYNSWLRWAAMNLRLQHFYSSDVQRPFRSQVQFVCCGCFLRAFSWVYIYKYTQIYRFVVNPCIYIYIHVYRCLVISAVLSIDGSIQIIGWCNKQRLVKWKIFHIPYT